jgi:serine protease DegQ
VAADVTGEHVALRPVFIGGLFPAMSPLWSGEIWLLPADTAIAPGTFVFTTEGAFAGLGVRHEQDAALVPAALLNRAVEQLQQPRTPGELGITVQPLSASIASATGASAGVVVTAVDPDGPAAGKLVATEVIEAIDGEAVQTFDHWRARAARAASGDTLTLRVRGSGVVRDVPVTAIASVPPAEPADEPTLGLRLRSIPKVGVEVLSVQPRSRSARAGIQQGDLITVAGGHSSPSSAQFTELFVSLPQGGSLVVALTRGNERHVIAIEK